MKNRLCLFLACLLLCSSALAAELPNKLDGWQFIGLTNAQVSISIPKDCLPVPLTADEEKAGVLFYLVGPDCQIQGRSYTPDVYTFDSFLEILRQTPSALLTTEDRDGLTLAIFRNTEPTEYSQLCGILFTGADGMLYKISFFTGDDGDFSETAKVWEVADQVAASVIPMDFSDWPLEPRDAA